jgi:transcriptional accessory protein Tex/SPT6
VAVGETVSVTVLSVDYEKEKVSLTMRTDWWTGQKSPAPQKFSQPTTSSQSTSKVQLSDEKLGDSGMRGNIVFR